MNISYSQELKVIHGFLGQLTKNGNKSNAFAIVRYLLFTYKLKRKGKAAEFLAKLIYSYKLPLCLKTRILPGRKKRSIKVRIPVFFFNEQQSINFLIKLICTCAEKQVGATLGHKIASELKALEEKKGLTYIWLLKYKSDILKSRFNLKKLNNPLTSFKFRVKNLKNTIEKFGYNYYKKPLNKSRRLPSKIMYEKKFNYKEMAKEMTKPNENQRNFNLYFRSNKNKAFFAKIKNVRKF